MRPEIDDDIIEMVDEMVEEIAPLPSDEFSTNQKLRMVIEDVYEQYQQGQQTDGVEYISKR